MAPGGQGALVDVCDSKARPQRPVRTRRPGMGPGRAATQGRLGTGDLKVLGAGATSETTMSKGETEAQRGEGLA